VRECKVKTVDLLSLNSHRNSIFAFYARFILCTPLLYYHGGEEIHRNIASERMSESGERASERAQVKILRESFLLTSQRHLIS
jgi:hypothetical protein